MALTLLHEALYYSIYFAPRGKKRIMLLGHQIAQRYMSPMDCLIGFVGEAGAGKSALVKGMFPGLELTNDDDGVNVRPLPILENLDTAFFSSHTYHLDVRFESAFTQMHVLADAVIKAVGQKKRVIVEHFDLLYPHLGVNAELLIGIGEEVFVARPSVFGPDPTELAKKAFESVKYRKMAHSAEDITSKVLQDEYGFGDIEEHNDVRRGFTLEFPTKPAVDLAELEAKVQAIIDSDIQISYYDDHTITMNGEKYPCTGPRIHVRKSSEIQDFHLAKDYNYNPITKVYSIVGTVGQKVQPNKFDMFNNLA